jgi:hypothetical protein
MKSLLAVAALILGVSLLGTADEPKEPKRDALEGAWENVTEGFPKDQLRQIKLITAGHFQWVVYDLQSKTTSTMAGGPYTLKGDSYKETIAYGTENVVQDLGGKEQPFTIRLDGDKFTQSGTLTNGTKIDETWRRIK